MVKDNNGEPDPKPDGDGSKPDEGRKPDNTEPGDNRENKNEGGHQVTLKDAIAERKLMEKAAAEMKVENNRREKFLIDKELEGTGFAGVAKNVPKLTGAEIASNARVQMIGEVAGAQWAKKPEEKN